MFCVSRSRNFQSCLLLFHASPVFNQKHFPTKSILRTASLLPKLLNKSVVLDKSHHRLVYSFPYMPYIAGFLRSKKSVPVASFLLLPVLYYIDGSFALPIATAVSAGMYFATGKIISKFTVNLVGKMYINKEGKITEVIMSSLDEAGRRIDRIHKVEDLINIDYLNNFSRGMGFIAIGVENSGIYYKINTRHCKFVDPSACDTVFSFEWDRAENEASKSENTETQNAEDIKNRLPEK